MMEYQKLNSNKCYLCGETVEDINIRHDEAGLAHSSCFRAKAILNIKPKDIDEYDIDSAQASNMTTQEKVDILKENTIEKIEKLEELDD